MTRRFRLVWTEVAIADLEGIVDYVAVHDSLAAAEKLYGKLDTRIGSLVASPERCRIVPELRAEGLEMYRELVVSKYRVLFRVRGREVVLLGVLDGRRDLDELLIQRALGDVL
jgi:plasmid stabilization system protein ParE